MRDDAASHDANGVEKDNHTHHNVIALATEFVLAHNGGHLWKSVFHPQLK